MASSGGSQKPIAPNLRKLLAKVNKIIQLTFRHMLNHTLADCETRIEEQISWADSPSERKKWRTMLVKVEHCDETLIEAVCKQQTEYLTSLLKVSTQAEREQNEAKGSKNLRLISDNLLEDTVLLEKQINELSASHRERLDLVQAHVRIITGYIGGEIKLLEPKQILDNLSIILFDLQFDKALRQLFLDCFGAYFEQALHVVLEQSLAILPKNVDEKLLASLINGTPLESDKEQETYELYDFQPPPEKISVTTVKTTEKPLGLGTFDLSHVRISPDVIMLSAFKTLEHNDAIPGFIRDQISKLREPVVSTVIHTPTALINESPLRYFVNELTELGMGVSVGKGQFLEKKLENLVDRAVDQCSTDPASLSSLLGELRAMVALEKRREAMLSRRISEAQKGRLKKERAKDLVKDALLAQIDGFDVPDLLSPLFDAWGRYLVYMACKQEGDLNSDVIEGIKDISDLVALLQPLDQESKYAVEKPERSKLLDQVKSKISAGLDYLSISDQEIELVMASLGDLLEDQINPNKGHPSDAAVQTPLKPGDETSELEQTVTSESSDDVLSDRCDASIGLAEEIRRSRELRANSQLIRDSEQTGSKALVAEEEAAIPVLPEDSEYLRQVDLMIVGTLVEFREGPGKNVRCKLGVAIKEFDRWIFTNAMGDTLYEKGRQELAANIQMGLCVVLEDRLVFDNALAKIISDNRQMASQY